MTIAKAVTAFVAFMLLHFFQLQLPDGVEAAVEALVAAVAVWAVPNRPRS